jgi:hypothetical protein
MSTEPPLTSMQLVEKIRDGYSLSYGEAVAAVDAALTAEYMRGVMETLECCIGCGATKDDDCHCGETDEVEL